MEFASLVRLRSETATAEITHGQCRGQSCWQTQCEWSLESSSPLQDRQPADDNVMSAKGSDRLPTTRLTAVASSNTTILAFLTKARARLIRLRSPAEKLPPSSSTIVSRVNRETVATAVEPDEPSVVGWEPDPSSEAARGAPCFV